MSLLFRCVAGITAKSIAAVTKRHGGEIEELMRRVWPGCFGLNSTRKYQTIAKLYETVLLHTWTGYLALPNSAQFNAELEFACGGTPYQKSKPAVRALRGS
jgi:hypothetical protein